MRRSVELAAAARDEVGGEGRWVAASVGPYGAALANGEEYVGRYGLSVAELAEWHLPRLEILADAGADVLAIETVPDIDEAEALVGLVRRLGVPAWLSYTIDGLHTRAGQPLAEAFAVAADVPEIVAVGVNCCAPGDVLPAIESPARSPDKPVIVYPNSGEEWDGAASNVDRHGAVVVGPGAAVGGRRRTHCRRLLPGDARRHRGIAATRNSLSHINRESPVNDRAPRRRLGGLRRQLAVLQHRVDDRRNPWPPRPSGSCRGRCPCG